MQPHGQFDMDCRGQMLIRRPRGPFNLAGAMAYEARFRHELAGLVERPWGLSKSLPSSKRPGPRCWPVFVASLAGVPRVAVSFWQWSWWGLQALSGG